MIKSMTGYGRFEGQQDGRTVIVEMKSVNHRFFEFSCRTPRNYGFLEEKLKDLVSRSVSRGKVDVFVSIDSPKTEGAEIEIDHALAKAYANALRELCVSYNLRDDISATVVAKCEGVLTLRKPLEDEEKVWAAVKTGAEFALAEFMDMRKAEGESMFRDIKSRSLEILSLVERIENRSPGLVEEYRDRLYSKISEVLGDTGADPQRILTEAAIFADKTAVAEETVRLRSHLEQMAIMLESCAPVGRKLDFLVQEMNREANTIGSKICDAELSHIVVDIKSEIEKIREQIQNVE